jgi:hypothetical protein
MAFKLNFIIFLLALSLLLQNSCPFGAAGKTSIAPACGHCPLMRHCAKATAGQTAFASGSPSIHFPLFLFAVSMQNPTFRLEPFLHAAPLLARYYGDIAPREILKPPRA